MADMATLEFRVRWNMPRSNWVVRLGAAQLMPQVMLEQQDMWPAYGMPTRQLAFFFKLIP